MNVLEFMNHVLKQWLPMLLGDYYMFCRRLVCDAFNLLMWRIVHDHPVHCTMLVSLSLLPIQGHCTIYDARQGTGQPLCFAPRPTLRVSSSSSFISAAVPHIVPWCRITCYKLHSINLGLKSIARVFLLERNSSEPHERCGTYN